MIKNYFKIAWRSLWKHKRMTAINVAGLSIGMAATVLMVLWVQNELSFEKDQPNAPNIFRAKVRLSVSKTETWIWEHTPYVLSEAASKQIPEIENATRLKPNNYADIILHYKGNVISEKKSAYVDDQWFKIFHYSFIEGSVDAFVKNPFSLIITQSTAKKYFGDDDPLGKVVRIDTNNYQVQAVIKDAPANSSFQYGVFIPIAAQLMDPSEKKNALQWNNFNYLTFFQLKPGASTSSVSAKLNAIIQKNKKDDKSGTKVGLVNIRDMHFENDLQSTSFIHGNRTIVNVFIALAILLLGTACINYVNLTTARSSLRSKEVSVRKIVGADRLHLFGQFMSESLLVSLISLLVSVLLVQVCMPWFREFTGKQFTEPFTSPVIWLILFATLFVSFLLNGIYPATVLSSFNPLGVFRGKTVLNFKDAGLRRVLVVVQFTISVILIVGTIVIYTQMRFMQNIDLGYNKVQVFNFTFPWWKLKGFKYEQRESILKPVKQQLAQQSAIAGVSLASSGIVDFGNKSSGSFDWKGRPKDFDPTIAPLQADEDFQQLMHIKVKEGRWFNREKSDTHNVLLNETAVRELHLQQPVLGQRFMHQGDTGVIIGVVADFHYRSLHEKIGPMLISNAPGSSFYVKTTLATVQQALRRRPKYGSKLSLTRRSITIF